MVHLDEFVKVDGEHFEGDHEVLPEVELVHAADDVLLVLWIFLIQVLDQFGLHKTLLIEPFLVLQNLQSTIFPLLVIVALEDHTETAFSNFLDNFVSVGQVLIDLTEVFVSVGVKTVIGCLIESSGFRLLSWQHCIGGIKLLFLSLVHREEIYRLMLENLSPFDFPEVGTKEFEGIIRRHREPLVMINFVVATSCNVGCCCTVLFMSEIRHLGINYFF